MTITIKSRKAKARWLQNFVCQKISNLLNIPWGYEDDKEIKPRIMGDSGPDVILSNYVADMFGFRNIECKSAERWNILKDIEQIKKRAIGYLKNSPWLLVLKCKKIKNPIIIMDANYFFELLSLTIEIWKDIPGFEGSYKISNFGNIKSYLNRGKPKKEYENDSTILIPIIDNGYMRISLRKNNKTYQFFIHRLVLLTFIGPPPEKNMQGSHKNGNSLNNRLSNLCWETIEDNNKRKYNHGTIFKVPRGEDHYKTKLKDDEIEKIKLLYNTGEYEQSELANIFNVNQSYISKIINNKTRQKK